MTVKNRNETQVAEAAWEAHQRILEICEEEGGTPRAVIRTLVAGLNACEVRVFNAPSYDKQTGKKTGSRIKKSPQLVAWGPRLRAAELLMKVLAMEAPRRLDLRGEIDHGVHELSSELQGTLDAVYKRRDK